MQHSSQRTWFKSSFLFLLLQETETFFYLALEKWVDLNYSTAFCKLRLVQSWSVTRFGRRSVHESLRFPDEFTNRVKRKCHTLAQLIFNKESLIETLKETIEKADPLALQPVLE